MCFALLVMWGSAISVCPGHSRRAVILFRRCQWWDAGYIRSPWRGHAAVSGCPEKLSEVPRDFSGGVHPSLWITHCLSASQVHNSNLTSVCASHHALGVWRNGKCPPFPGGDEWIPGKLSTHAAARIAPCGARPCPVPLSPAPQHPALGGCHAPQQVL
jgi:hypothetical protein